MHEFFPAVDGHDFGPEMQTVSGNRVGDGLPDPARTAVKGKRKVAFGPQPRSSRPSMTLRKMRLRSTVATRSPTQELLIRAGSVAQTLKL